MIIEIKKKIKQFFFYLVVILLYIFHNFFLIRITRVYTRRVGHLSLQLDYLISWKKSNRNCLLLVATDDKISNKIIYLKLSRKIRFSIFSEKFLNIYKFIYNSSFLKKKLILKPLTELDKRKKKLLSPRSNLNFNKIENDYINNIIIKKKIKNNFVVLHNRDKTYEKKLKYRLNDNNSHDHRNFNFYSYKKIIDKFKSTDFIRLGQFASKNKLNNKNLYDLTNKNYNELEMLLMINKSNFVVTGATGFLDVGALLRKPILVTNFLPLSFNQFFALSPNSIILPKKIYSLKKRRLLKIKEIIDLEDKDIHKDYNFYEKNNLKIINNSQDEIFNAFCEMHKKISKNEDEKKINFEKKTQKKINLIPGMKYFYEKYKINISYSFLKNNNNLI